MLIDVQRNWSQCNSINCILCGGTGFQFSWSFALRDGPLEKLWGEKGIFEPEEFFFVTKIPCMIFFFQAIAWILARIFFWYFHKFSNGPSLTTLLLIKFILQNDKLIYVKWGKSFIVSNDCLVLGSLLTVVHAYFFSNLNWSSCFDLDWSKSCLVCSIDAFDW